MPPTNALRSRPTTSRRCTTCGHAGRCCRRPTSASDRNGALASTLATAGIESDRRSGSTLYVLPGDRAVLSGGKWNSELLEAAYNGGAPLPDLYSRGACLGQ